MDLNSRLAKHNCKLIWLCDEKCDKDYLAVKLPDGRCNYVDRNGDLLIKDDTLHIKDVEPFEYGFGVIRVWDEKIGKNYATVIDKNGDVLIKSKSFGDFRIDVDTPIMNFFVAFDSIDINDPDWRRRCNLINKETEKKMLPKDYYSYHGIVDDKLVFEDLYDFVLLDCQTLSPIKRYPLSDYYIDTKLGMMKRKRKIKSSGKKLKEINKI